MARECRVCLDKHDKSTLNNADRLLIDLLLSLPGIFFKYDIEPMSLTIEERTTSLIDFLVRLAGIVGGILVCSNYAWRGE